MKNHNENEVVIYYKDNRVVFVHPKPDEYVHYKNPIYSKCRYENIEVYDVSITYNLKLMGILKTILFDTIAIHNIIHESFIPAKGISLRVVDSKCICPHCGCMLKDVIKDVFNMP